MFKLSIIIPHFNGEKILTDCLQSLHKQDSNQVEILVVNNASTDDSIKKACPQFPEVEVIESPSNLGYAGGCNYGATHAKGEYLLFLNNDTTHDPNWLTPLIEKLDKHALISSVQPKILNQHQPDTFDYAGACGGFMDMYGYPFARGRIFDTVEKDIGQYNNAQRIFWASGTAFITRGSIFKAVGGFDETLFAHMEEIDYHWRCQLMGYEVWVEPKSVIYHLGGATLDYQSPQKTYLNHRNSIILLLTNYSILISLTIFIPRLFFEILSTLKDLISMRPLHAWAQIRALGWIVVHPHVLIKRRWLTYRLRNCKDGKMFDRIYDQPIIWQYFIRKKKTYSELMGTK